MHQVKVIQLKVPVSFVTDQQVTRSETGFSFSFSFIQSEVQRADYIQMCCEYIHRSGGVL